MVICGDLGVAFGDLSRQSRMEVSTSRIHLPGWRCCASRRRSLIRAACSSPTISQTAWIQLGDTATMNSCGVTGSALFTDTPATAPAGCQGY